MRHLSLCLSFSALPRESKSHLEVEGAFVPARLGRIQRESEASKKDAEGESLGLSLPLPEGRERE